MWEMQHQQQQQPLPPQRHYRSGGSSASESGLRGSAVLHPPGMPSTSEDLHAWSIYR